MNKVLVMKTLPNNFQMMKMCPILRMVLHTKIRNDWGGGDIGCVGEVYNPLLENDYSRAGKMLYVDTKTYALANVSVLYIYVNYNVIFIQFILLKYYNFVLYTCRSTTSLKITRKWSKWSGNCKDEQGKTIDQFWIKHEIFWSRESSLQTSHIWISSAIKYGK